MSLPAGLVIPASLALIAALSAPWQPAAAATAGSISGTVISATTGAPVGNVGVHVVSPTSPTTNWGWTSTAPDGTYQVTGLPEDSYYVLFDHIGGAYATERYDNAPGDYWNPTPTTPVAVTAGDDTPGINAALEPGGTITGTVRSGVTGGPIQYPHVCARDAAGARVLCSRSLSDGTYAIFGAPVGSFLIEFVPPSGSGLLPEYYRDAPDLASADPVTVAEGQTTAGIDAILDDPAGDHEPPVIAMTGIYPAPNAAGWWQSPVTAVFTCTDTGSEVVAATVTATVDTEGAGQQLTGVCEDTAGNVSSETLPNVNIDWTRPDFTDVTQDPSANSAGWVTSDTTVSWTCTDALSGPRWPGSSTVVTTEGAGQSVPLFCTDLAGNVEYGSHQVSLDRTPPSLSWVEPIEDGTSVLFGQVPPAPSCTSTDALSGSAGCTVSGYAATVGVHELTATAIDRAGNVTTAHRTYTVLPWTLVGFRPPVSMTAWNVVKAGASVPLKFEVFAGTEELTAIDVVDSITAEPTTCPSGAGAPSGPSAPVLTTLEYDTKAGYFTYTWKAPRTHGACLELSATTHDGSRLTAAIQVK